MQRLTLPVLILSMVMLGGCGRPAPTTELPPLPTLAPNAPEDQRVDSTDKKKIKELDNAIAPLIEQARKTYPDAKKRYLQGLPGEEHFFVVTKLRDSTGTVEQVFISVASIKDDRITGRIASDNLVVKGYKSGDPHTFPESELVDWLISKPDGSEEGNIVGKFLDEWQKGQHR
jgi:predicted small lipoprotein YifL